MGMAILGVLAAIYGIYSCCMSMSTEDSATAFFGDITGMILSIFGFEMIANADVNWLVLCVVHVAGMLVWWLWEAIVIKLHHKALRKAYTAKCAKAGNKPTLSELAEQISNSYLPSWLNWKTPAPRNLSEAFGVLMGFGCLWEISAIAFTWDNVLVPLKERIEKGIKQHKEHKRIKSQSKLEQEVAQQRFSEIPAGAISQTRLTGEEDAERGLSVSRP